VLLHYAKGVRKSETLSPLLKEGEKVGIELSPQEQSDIIEFLHTLTDKEFINKY